MVLCYGPWVARLETNSFSKKTKISVAASKERQWTALQAKMRAFNSALKALGSGSNMLRFLVERNHSESCLECARKGHWTRARETKQETRSNQVIWAGPDSRLLAPGPYQAHLQKDTVFDRNALNPAARTARLLPMTSSHWWNVKWCCCKHSGFYPRA